MPGPTPHPDVNAVLRTVLSDVKDILGDLFLGMYISGSLAMGDFDASSDIDVLFVVTDTLPDGMVADLAAMHERFATEIPGWGAELEASYVPLSAMRRYDPSDDAHPYIGRGERLRVEEHRREWDTHRYEVRERGVVVEGPDPRTFIDPVGPDALRLAVRETLREWRLRHFQDPAELHPRGYRSYIVLTACRMLYTLEHGTLASKPVAARWALGSLDPRWSPLIEWSLAARRDLHPKDEDLTYLDETLDFIRCATGSGG